MKVLMVVFGLVLAAGVCASQELELPEPTGIYAVGTTHLVLVDEARPELFTDDPDEHREITVRAWYPADAGAEGEFARYYEKAEGMAARFGYPQALEDLRTHSRPDVPVSRIEEKYPVVLFNHGWGEHALQSQVLLEELASHGYVVFSITHHYEAKFWVYPDGRLGFLDPGSSRFMKMMQDQNKPGIMDLFQAMFTTRGMAAQEALFRRSVEAMPLMLRETPRMWAEDIGFIVGELDTLDRSEGLFKNKLDLDKIAAVGMSMGGAAAGQACIANERIKACMNIDGGLLGDLADTVVTQPTMFMGSRRFVAYDSVFAAHTSGDVYVAIVRDADHYDFTDFTLLNRNHPMIGTVDGLRMLEIVNAYSLAFLDVYLKGTESDLLGGEGVPFPEVDFRVFRDS